MLSLDTSKKLKNAGLEWDWQVGDWFYDFTDNPGILIGGNAAKAKGVGMAYDWEDIIFAPRIDLLLTEIEKRGWTWMLYAPNDEGKYGIDIGNGSIYDNNKTILADSPDEAAAQALLWILERETNDRIKSDCQRRSQNPGWMNGNGGGA